MIDINTIKQGAQSTTPWGAIAGAATGALGMIGQGAREERQMKNQENLMGLQFAHQKKLNEQGAALQQKMWENTSYPAQLKMMKEAGLSPGLMYGQSGGGGTTTGSQGGGSAASGNAPQQMPMELGAMLQAVKLGSEIAVNRASAEKMGAETEKTKGVDTEKTVTEIANLTQGIQNQKAIMRLTEAQEEAQRIDNWINSSTKTDQAYEIINSSKRALYDMGIARSMDKEAAATIETRIKMVGAEYLGALIRNKAVLQDIELSKEKAREIGQSIQQKWTALSQSGYGLGQKDQELNIKKFAEELKASYPNVMNFTGHIIQEISDIGAYIDEALYGIKRKSRTID